MKKLIDQMAIYLESKPDGSSEEERRNRQSTIDFLKESYGLCDGLSTLWAYDKKNL